MGAVLHSPVDFGLPGDRIPENPTVDIRKVIGIFENAGIPCCMSGVSALVWFGAWRVRFVGNFNYRHLRREQSDRKQPYGVKTGRYVSPRTKWTTQLSNRSHQSLMTKSTNPQPFSMNQLFPRFKLRGVNVRFQIIPFDDAYFDFHEVDRSVSDLPYPKLLPFAQSLLDTQRRLDLCELIDGLNLSEAWGEENLNLDKMIDLEYARRKNEKLAAATPPGEEPYQRNRCRSESFGKELSEESKGGFH